MNQETLKTVTIEDVAKASDVSIGTVDRVLHNRIGVSNKTKTRVLDVIDKLGYKTNIYASVLSKRKRYNVIALIPKFNHGDYWELVYNGIMQSVDYAAGLNVNIQLVYYNQFKEESFLEACNEVIGIGPDGLFVTFIYKSATIDLVNKLYAKRRIPVVYTDAKPEQRDNYLAYFGMPLFESGYLVADLLVGGDRNVKKIVNFNIDRGQAPPNDSMLRRHQGFLAYLSQFNPNSRLVDVTISPSDVDYNFKLFDNFFAQNPDIDKIVTFNSRAYIISDWLESRSILNKKLVGFDMLDKNMSALKRGLISTLIAERTDLSALNSITALVDNLVFGRLPDSRDNYCSIDILTRYNVDFYLKKRNNM